MREDRSDDPSINHDTAGANAGALTQQYDDAKRKEIEDGFEAAQLLKDEAGTFLANRAREAEQKQALLDSGMENGRPISDERRGRFKNSS